MKIKTRKEREKEYELKYGNVSNDKYIRLRDELGDEFTPELFEKALERVKKGRKNTRYYSIRFTFYEEPVQSHRARTKGKNRKGLYVPNAKSNFLAVEDFINKLKKDISVVTTPMKIVLKAYYPMPSNLKPIEILLYETEHDYAIGKPDFDNVLKAYSDMLLKHVILDDDLVSSSSFDKYFSLKPRVELDIIYTNGYASEYTYSRIKTRKTFKELKNAEVILLVDPYKRKPKRRKKT